MVREEDAKVFVVDAHQLLAVRGHDPVITPANEARLTRYAVLMLDAFGLGGGRETTEETDG